MYISAYIANLKRELLTRFMTSVRSPVSSSSGVGGSGRFGAPPIKIRQRQSIKSQCVESLTILLESSFHTFRFILVMGILSIVRRWRRRIRRRSERRKFGTATMETYRLQRDDVTMDEAHIMHCWCCEARRPRRPYDAKYREAWDRHDGRWNEMSLH